MFESTTKNAHTQEKRSFFFKKKIDFSCVCVKKAVTLPI